MSDVTEGVRINLVIGEDSALMAGEDIDSLARREALCELRDYLVEQLSAVDLPSAPGSHPVEMVVRSRVPRDAGEVQIRFRKWMETICSDIVYERASTLRDGRRGALCAIAIFMVMNLAAVLIRCTWQGHAADGIAESLVVVGWVAMWRPLEVLLYDRIPFRRRLRLFDRLAGATIRLEPIGPTGRSAG